MTNPTDEPTAPTRRQPWPRWAQALGWGALVLATLILSLHRQWAGLLTWAGHHPAEAPTWQQVMPLAAEIEALAQDERGNIYLAGTFEDTLRLGPTTLISAGETDIFVACWQPGAGRFQWVKQAGGPGYDVANALAVRGGAVYVAGYVGAIEPRHATTAYFDSLALPSGGITDMFVAKLASHEATEVFEWVQGMRGARYSDVQKLAVRGTAVYLAGVCQADSCFLGKLPLNANPFGGPPTDSTTCFLARLTDYGGSSQYAWVQPLPDRPLGSYFTGLGVADSTLYLTGNFAQPADNDGVPTYRPSDSPIIPTEPNILKYQDRGTHATLAWVRRLAAPGASPNEAGVITVATLAMQGARLFVAGSFERQAQLGATILTAPGEGGYVACLTDGPGGLQYAWATALTGPVAPPIDFRAFTLALHDSAVYVAGRYAAAASEAGYFKRSTPLASPVNALANLINALASPVSALARHTDSATDYDQAGFFITQVIDTGLRGQVRWQQASAGHGAAYVTALAATAGPLYVAGTYEPGAQFGRLPLPSSGRGQPERSAGFWAVLGATPGAAAVLAPRSQVDHLTQARLVVIAGAHATPGARVADSRYRAFIFCWCTRPNSIIAMMMGPYTLL